MQLYFSYVFRCERHATNLKFQLLGIEYHYVFQFLSVLELYINSLIAHSSFGKSAEILDPAVR